LQKGFVHTGDVLIACVLDLIGYFLVLPGHSIYPELEVVIATYGIVQEFRLFWVNHGLRTQSKNQSRSQEKQAYRQD
jgi:hypothetical protein